MLYPDASGEGKEAQLHMNRQRALAQEVCCVCGVDRLQRDSLAARLPLGAEQRNVRWVFRASSPRTASCCCKKRLYERAGAEPEP